MTAISEFKKLINEMYRGFPNYVYPLNIDAVISDLDVKQTLIDQGLLVKIGRSIHVQPNSKPSEQELYMLGTNGLNLVNSWKIEELTKKLNTLTYVLVGLTVIIVILTLILVVLTGYLAYSTT